MNLEQHGMYTARHSSEKVREQAEALVMPYREIGIIGGMGPAATIDLFKGIVDQTSERFKIGKDQDHLEIFIANIPQVPDRTAFVLYDMGIKTEPAEDPFPYLVRGVNKLAAVGVKNFGIPCNTAHYFADALEKYIDESNLDMRLVNMIEETADEVVAQGFSKGTKVGVLATTGTLQSGLYHNALIRRGFEVIVPNEDEQENEVMEAIYGKKTKVGIKLNSPIRIPRARLLKAVNSVQEKGAGVVLTACTEIPLALKQKDTKVRLINPTSVLGDRLISLARPA